MTREEIQEKLRTNDSVVIWSLVKLYERQTRDEQAAERTIERNNAGFNAFDSDFCSSLVKQILNGKTLTPKQIAAARKLLPKYSAQLAEIASVNGNEDFSISHPIKEEQEELIKLDPRGKIRIEGNFFVVSFDYDAKLVDVIKTFAGRKYNPSSREWSIPVTPSNMEKAVEILTPYGFQFPEGFGNKKQEITQLFKKIATNVIQDFKLPLELQRKLYPFQKEGVKFLLETGGKAILGDEMGLGKTVEAIAYFQATNMKKVLIVCPASIKLTWRNEIVKFAPERKDVEVVYSNGGGKRKFGSEITIINYDIVGKFINELKEAKFDLIILDEFHYIKNYKALRTKAVHKLSNIPHKLLLSGTPLLNRPIELYSPLNYLIPKQWGSIWNFGKQYCGAKQTRWGWDFSGASNLEELKKRLMPIMIRRLKKDVLEDLPDKIHQDIEIELSKELRKEYERAYEDLIQWLLEQKMKEEAERASRAEQLVQVSYLKQLLIGEKVEAAKELIDTIIESDKKVIVFSQFLMPIYDLKKYYGNKAVSLLGETKIEDRQKAVEAFQTNSEIKVFVGSLKAAGLGLTLTAADTVVFLDLAWTPNDHAQAEDRAHRIGQKNVLNVYRIIAKGTIDGKIGALLDKKREIINAVVDGNEEIREVNVFADFLKDLTSADTGNSGKIRLDKD